MTRLAFRTQDLAQYQLQASVADFQAEMKAYRQASDRSKVQLADFFSTHAYGDHAVEKLDVYAAREPGSPVYMFIHGGYWRMLGRDDSAMMARSLHAAGAAVICVDYGLAPSHSLPHMVAQCERALEWVWRHARSFNGDPARLHVSGSSAGAQLAGMLLAGDARRSERRIHSASLISGLMDLHPLMQTPVNDWLHLDADQAQAFSPSLHPPAARTPLLVAWGALEPAVMQAQSIHYAQQCRMAGCAVRSMAIADRHHFNVLMDLEQGDSALTRALLQTLNCHAKEETP